MKKALVVSLALLFAATTVFAVNFTPNQLKLTGPNYIQYDFDGKALTIPVTASGTAASVTLLVYTTGKGNTVTAVKNGYLGWHYVNNIDTCVYFSDPNQMSKGTGNIVWDGKDKAGKAVATGDYTYYLFGYDNQGVKVLATSSIGTRAHNAFLRF